MDSGVTMHNGVILGNSQAAPGHFILSVQLPPAFETPLPGQFVMVRQTGQGGPLLARPLSVFGFEKGQDHTVLELLCRVAGVGTSLFSRMTPGDPLAVLGPLGRGFTLPAGVRRVLFVAGGVGVAPLVYLLHSGLLKDAVGQDIEKKFYLGARGAELLTAVERLRGFCELGICTDDGSQGYHGPVTALLERDIQRYDPQETVIYACGPTPMIRALGAVLRERPMSCQVSLEERMACGLGACLGCAVAIRNPDGRAEYQRVCKDGPVFDLGAVLLQPPPIA